MSKEISLFSGYSQDENRTTNYCLLVLKMLYEENPRFLAEVFNSLFDEQIGDLVGVKFNQQVKSQNSTPDGLISQHSFTIYIETKHFDWFYDSQLESHLDGLCNEPGNKILMALGQFDGPIEDRFSRIKASCEKRSRKGKDRIAFSAASFEDFLQALQSVEHLPKNLSDSLVEFQTYLDEANLLPSWMHWLDVINCAGIPEDILKGNVYMCPAVGGAYSHKRCKYFGMYRNKTVDLVAHIRAVVDLLGEKEVQIKWDNIQMGNETAIEEARAKLAQWRPDAYPTRVFLLGKLHPTHFYKDSRGGMMGSKIYFDIGSLNAEDVEALAEKLKDKAWSQFK